MQVGDIVDLFGIEYEITKLLELKNGYTLPVGQVKLICGKLGKAKKLHHLKVKRKIV